MDSKTERDDARKPYDPPALRELGKVSEVTFGLDLVAAADNAVASV
jgi:hypothetical protein